MTTIITRASKGSPLSWSEADANFTNLNDDKAEVSVVDLKAPLDSPSLTGVPTAPTAVSGTNTTQLATTAFVQGKTASQTPSTAVGNIAATTVQAALEELDTEKASLTGANFSGQVTATKLQTGVSGTNTNNFILDASAADGTMKLERGDGQDIMTVDAAGKVSFPQNVVPTFSAKINTPQVTSSSVWAAITSWVDEFDSNSALNGTTFQPTVAGYYQINASVDCTGTGVTLAGAAIYKNAVQLMTQFNTLPTANQAVQSTSGVVYLNGSTDYVDVRGFISASASPAFGVLSRFSGCLVRAA